MIQRTDFERESASDTDPSIGTLLKELVDESRTLLHQELELAKVEISEKASVVGRNAGFITAGGLVLYAGLLAIIAAACVGMYFLLRNSMDSDIAAWLGPLIVGAIVAIIGYIFVQNSINTLKRESLMPRKTIKSLRENTEWLKDQVKTTGNRMTNRDRDTAIR